jgi:hypothetical protein
MKKSKTPYNSSYPQAGFLARWTGKKKKKKKCLADSEVIKLPACV